MDSAIKSKQEQINYRTGTKEIVERRHGEPVKFLFLPKMGLLGIQAGNKKMMAVNYEQLLRAVFSYFHSQNSIFHFFTL